MTTKASIYAATNRNRQFAIAVRSIVSEVIFQFFSGTEVKITCQQVLFSYLETLIFRHVAFCLDDAIFLFHSPLRASFQVRLRGVKKKSPCFQVFREGTRQVPMQFVTFAI